MSQSLIKDKIIKIITLSNGNEVTFFALPSLDLYVITDVKGFGPNWIKIDYTNNIYSSDFLLGHDTNFSSIARFFAQKIIESQKSNETLDNFLPDKESRKLMINISLRDHSVENVREIGKKILE